MVRRSIDAIRGYYVSVRPHTVLVQSFLNFAVCFVHGPSVYRCNKGVLCERKTSYSTSSIFLKLCCVFCSWSVGL